MSPYRSSLVLLVDHEEAVARALERALAPQGYVVLRARTGREGLEMAASVRPDLVLTELRLPDMPGGQVCEQMRRLSTVGPGTPILAFSAEFLGRRERLDSVRMGAWDVLTPPFDPEEILARVDRYVAAKRDADAATGASHIDPETGFYNVRGLRRRVVELVADARRSGRPLACVVVGPVPAELPPSAGQSFPAKAGGSALEGGGGWVERLVIRTTRRSDAVGRVGRAEFAVLAPGADEGGAMRLAERLLEAFGAEPAGENGASPLRFRAGVCAVRPEHVPDRPEDLLTHAATAFLAVSEGEPIGIGRLGADA